MSLGFIQSEGIFYFAWCWFTCNHTNFMSSNVYRMLIDSAIYC